MIDVPISLAFMSHAREDEPTVAEITRRLNDFAVVTWFDKQSLIPGVGKHVKTYFSEHPPASRKYTPKKI